MKELDLLLHIVLQSSDMSTCNKYIMSNVWERFFLKRIIIFLSHSLLNLFILNLSLNTQKYACMFKCLHFCVFTCTCVSVSPLGPGLSQEPFLTLSGWLDLSLFLPHISVRDPRCHHISQPTDIPLLHKLRFPGSMPPAFCLSPSFGCMPALVISW